MLLTSAAAVLPTLVVDRAGRRLQVDPATLTAALHHLRPRPVAMVDRAVQAAGDARLRSAGLVADTTLVPWAARLLGPVARDPAPLEVEVFEGGEVTGFGLWQDDTRGTLGERRADGVMIVSTIPALHGDATIADLVGLDDPPGRSQGEAVTINERLLSRFLGRLAAGDTPRAGGLLAGRPVSLQALRALLALADGRARWWSAERTTDSGGASPGTGLQVIDAGAGGLWCSQAENRSLSSELVLAPAYPDQIRDRLAALCGSCAGVTSAA